MLRSRRWVTFTSQRVLFILLALYALLACAYNVTDPIFEPPDERLHYDLVRYLQQHRALPVVRLGDPPSEYHQPPLYYTLAALLSSWIPNDDYATQTLQNPFWAYNIGEVGRDNKNQFLHGPQQQFPYRGTSLAVHLLRLFSTLAGVVTVYWTYCFSLRLLPDHPPLALATAALVAFTPNFLLTTAAVTNDSYISLAPVGLVLYMFHLLDQSGPPHPGQWMLLSLGLSLAVLVKVSSYPVMAVSAVLAAMLAWRHRSWHIFITAGVILLGGVLLVTGWWFWRNLMLYGDLTGLGQMWKVWGTRAPLTLEQLRTEAWNFRTTYWANFGYGNVPAPEWLYGCLDAATALGIAGLLVRVFDRVRGRTAQPHLSTDKVALVTLWMGLTWMALFWYLQRTLQVTGRQVYAILPALSFCLIWGWARLVPRRWYTWFSGAVMVAMFSLGIGALWGVLLPAYQRSPRVTAEQAEGGLSHRLNWQVGDVATLLGYRLSASAVNPGEHVIITLYWKVLRAPVINAAVYVQFLGEANRQLGARTTYPGLGNDPMVYWTPGDIIEDSIPIPVTQQVEAGPILLDILVGLYDLKAGQPLTSLDEAGRPIEFPVAGQLKLNGSVTEAPEPAYPLHQTFEGGLRLKGYDLSTTDPRPGEILLLTLYWSPSGPLAGDYIVFIHMLDSHGQLVAQGDGPPRDGRYPTSVWGPGETFDDPHSLPLPENLPAGKYTLSVGLYNPFHNTRLPLRDGSDELILSSVVVTP